MKILMLGWELPPHNSGGLGVACYHMCRHLARSGVGIAFVLPYTADHSGIDFMDIIPAHPQNALSVLQSGTAYESYRYKLITSDGAQESLTLYDQQLLYAKNVELISRTREFDIIHAHDWLTFRAAMTAKTQSGKPLIVHIHSTEYDRSGGRRGNPLVGEIEYQAMMMADQVVTVSQATRDIVSREYSIPKDKISVVHNSIEAADYEADDGANVYHYLQVMKQHGYKVISNIGRLTIQKGLTHLLRSAKLVLDYQPRTLFLIVGSGDQYHELIELSAELGISGHVLFTGFQRGKAWRDAYRISDLFVMPSVSEPFGLTPLEAALFGVPSLVSKQSGVIEVISNILQVDYWDTDETANQIVGALRSEGLRAVLSAESQDELKKMSWSQAADKLNAIYDRHLVTAAGLS